MLLTTLIILIVLVAVTLLPMSQRVSQVFAAITFVVALSLMSMVVVPKLEVERNTIMPPLDIKKVATLDPSATVANAALTIFRGLAVDIFWYQANQLKEEGRYFDANNKAEVITELQPRFPKVWAFHAWNMAYNISVATYTPEERWDWVNKGINLLRDRGIPYNPKSVILYKELSWIFAHKIGQYSDDMHWYYKRNLAQEWQEVLAPNDGLTTAQAIKQFMPIVQAPETLEELLKRKPEIAPLLEQLKNFKQPLLPNESLLRRISRLMMFNNTKTTALLGFKLENFPDMFDATDRELVKIISEKKYTDAPVPPEKPKSAEAATPLDEATKIDQAASDAEVEANAQPEKISPISALLSFLRRRVIIDRYHMDPQRMLDFMRLFGPLDFRHPGAHACYWATMGTKVVESGMPPGEIDLLNTYRGSIHALQALAWQGRVNFDPVTKKLDYLPDPRFIPAYEKALDLTRIATSQPGTQGGNDSFDAGYENFLLTAVVYSYLYGEEKQAAEYYEKIRRLFGTKPDNVRSGRYTVTLDELVLKEMTDTIDILSHARQAIDGFLMQAFNQGLRNDRRDVYDRFVKVARYVHKTFNEKAGSTPLADQKRMGLLPFEQIIEESLLGFLRDAADPIERARVWNAAGGISELADARYSIYDTLHDQAYKQAEDSGLNPALAWAEPPNMAQWRLTHKPRATGKVTGDTTNASGTPASTGRLNSEAVGTDTRPPARDDSVRVEEK